MKKMKLIKHNNCTRAKLKNKSVVVFGGLKDDSMLIEFSIFDSITTPRAMHKVFRDKVTCTGISLSNEGALGLFLSLGEELKKKGLVQ